MARKRVYSMRKSDLVAALYQMQEPICPLCKRTLLPEIQMWINWKDKILINGRRVRRKDANLNIDHIVAVADGGTDDIENLALTHKRCNDIRGKVNIYTERPARAVQ